MGAKESAIAKSTGHQQEDDMSEPDAALLRVLRSKRKISKKEANYRASQKKSSTVCVKCKFNLGDEEKCHVVGGRIDNEQGVSKFFSPKGDGMLPGDIVWHYVKTSGKKLAYGEGHVIKEGAKGFRCEDCKYYLHSGGCLLIKGRFKPKMSCGYVVKIGHGVEL